MFNKNLKIWYLGTCFLDFCQIVSIDFIIVLNIYNSAPLIFDNFYTKFLEIKDQLRHKIVSTHYISNN